jgi:metal-responsive CopG/Arc/MetJ family transcriptional regulator
MTGGRVAKGTAKVAVSLPDELYRALENARRRARKTRSAVVQEALRDWLGQRARAELVRDYEEGYRRRPETAREAEAALATTIGLLTRDDEW